jgi:hypothetical protein
MTHTGQFAGHVIVKFIPFKTNTGGFTLGVFYDLLEKTKGAKEGKQERRRGFTAHAQVNINTRETVPFTPPLQLMKFVNKSTLHCIVDSRILAACFFVN